MNNKVVSESVERIYLSNQDVIDMFRVFERYYENASKTIFIKDLNNKNWVVLIKEAESNQIVGFSTLTFYQSLYKGKTVSVVYSGDTIIEQDYWGTPELPRRWVKTVLEVGVEYPQPLYWLLISSGYKTYRYLSVFYQEFYPHFKIPTPLYIQGLMNHLAKERFGEEYIIEKGIVRFREGATPLKSGVADIVNSRLKNPHIRFFIEKNPGHINGDELVCLTKIQPDNFTPAGIRLAK